MKLIFFLLTYFFLLFAEVSLLPPWLGTSDLPLTAAVLVLGVVSLNFTSGFWFAGLAGFTHDALLAPGAFVSHTAFAFFIFFAVHFFTTLIQWDEPLNRISAMVVGFLAIPLAWPAGAAIAHIFFKSPLTGIDFTLLTGPLVVRWVVFAGAVAALFAIIQIRKFQRRRVNELTYL